MMMRTMLVCAQHHDDRGTRDTDGEPLLSAAIVHLADRYDHDRREDPLASPRQILAELGRKAEVGQVPADLVGVLRAAIR
jgi:hypothetical protein